MYPQGFRYKILSAHDKKTATVAIVTLIEQPNGHELEMKRCEVAANQVDDFIHLFVNGLGEEYKLTFTRLDYSQIETMEELQRLLAG